MLISILKMICIPLKLEVIKSKVNEKQTKDGKFTIAFKCLLERII